MNVIKFERFSGSISEINDCFREYKRRSRKLENSLAIIYLIISLNQLIEVPSNNFLIALSRKEQYRNNEQGHYRFAPLGGCWMCCSQQVAPWTPQRARQL